MKFALQARVVYPVDRPPIEDGVVTIDGERIVSIGTKADGGEVDDLGSVALLPGLVNAHTHLEFSHLARPLGQPGTPLVEWIRLVIAERGRGASQASKSIAAGLAESIRCGVTTIGDITPDGTDAFADLPLDRTLFLEAIGFSRARAESAFASVEERFLSSLGSRLSATFSPEPSATVGPVPVADGSGLNEESCRQPTVRIGLSPHAPYTVSPELLAKLVRLAARRDMPVAMHLAESADELEFLNEGTGSFQQLLEERSMWDASAVPRGSRPLDYLRLLSAAPRAAVIHGNYLDAQERTFLAANAARMSLVHCPRTHAYFAHAPYPLGELLAAGVRVALGTDSRASNPDLDLLAEMRYLARVFPRINPYDVLRMGTLAGAEALGRAEDVGSITPGKLANLIAVPVLEDAGGPEELLASLLASRDVPRAVWIRGQPSRLT